MFSRHVSAYVIWTVLWSVFYVAMLGLDVHYSLEYKAKYFIYLTNWSYLLQAAFVFSDLLTTVYVYKRRKDIVTGETNTLPWYIQAVWVLYNISNAISILVTILYYALLIPTFDHASINKHLINSIYTILLILFCAKPTRLLHVYQPVIYAAMFTVFSAIYQVSGGDRIYSVLDWDSPGKAALVGVLAVIIGVPITHIFCFATYTLRMFIASKFFKTKNVKIRREIPSRDAEQQVDVFVQNGVLP